MRADRFRTAMVVVLTCVAGVPAATAAPTSCAPDEDTVFSCKAGRKLIAVCRSHDATATLQYRFGSPAEAELALSSGATGASRVTVTGKSLVFSGGGGAYLRFSDTTTDYVVYTAISSSWGEQSGVVPERNGRQLRGVHCTGKVRSMIGPQFFKDVGIAPDSKDFVVPR